MDAIYTVCAHDEMSFRIPHELTIALPVCVYKESILHLLCTSSSAALTSRSTIFIESEVRGTVLYCNHMLSDGSSSSHPRVNKYRRTQLKKRCKLIVTCLACGVHVCAVDEYVTPITLYCRSAAYSN